MLQYLKLLDSFTPTFETLGNNKEFQDLLNNDTMDRCLQSVIGHFTAEHMPFSDNFTKWKELFGVNLQISEWQTKWQNQLKESFTSEVKKVSPEKQVNIYCTFLEENVSGISEIEDCLFQCAAEACSSLCKKEEKTLQSTLEIMTKHKQSQIISVIIENILGHLPISVEDLFCEEGTSQLGLFLISQNSLDLISHLSEHKNPEYYKTLSRRAQQCIAKTKELMAFLLQIIISGEVPCSLLYVVLYCSKAVDMYRLFSEEISNTFQDALGKKHEMYEDLKRKKTQAEKVLDLCKCVTDITEVETLELQNIREIQLHEEIRSINQIMEIMGSGCGRESEDGVRKNYTNMFHKIDVLMNSTYFKESWKQKARSAKDTLYKNTTSPITLEELHENIYKPTLVEFTQSYMSFKELSMNISDLKLKFGKIISEKLHFEKELKAMEDFHHNDNKIEDQWISATVLHVDRYETLSRVIKTAMVVNSLRKDLPLKGKFGPLESLQDGEDFTSQQLKDLTEEMVQVGSVLKTFPGNIVDFLEELYNCSRKGFISWIKNIIKDFTELPVFVDLASISAGENDMDVDKVRFFRDAVTASAPIIYLTPDTGLDEFEEAVKLLTITLQNDPKAKEKLIDSCNNKDWLQIVHDAHGSVERSSLSHARAINRNGIYFISRPSLDSMPTLNDCITLRLNESTTEDTSAVSEKVQYKTYCLPHLIELQNKLMLISATVEQGHDEIENYVKVLEYVLHAGELYLQLLNAGHVLFIDWKLSVYCGSDRAVKVRVDFGIAGVPVNGTNPVNEELQGLCESMKICLDAWQKFLETQRNEYYYLNYFTANQLVTLCCDIAKLKESGKLSTNVLTMLSFIKNDVTIEDLRDSLEKALKTPAKSCGSLDLQSSDLHKYLFKFPKLIEDLKKAGEEETKAKAALQHCGTSVDVDEDTLMECIFDHLNNDEEIENLSKAFDDTKEKILTNQMKFKGVQSNEEADSSFTMTEEEVSAMFESLPSCQEKIMMLWQVYSNRLSGLVSDKYISLDVIGETLNCLADKESFSVERKIPSFMEKGKPNLIMCKDAEMLPLMLSVYEDEAQPLPTYDEVLTCTSETSAEEVELIIRRALKSGQKSSKIYCLLAADKLNNKVARKMEYVFFQISQNQTVHEYSFLILCDSAAQNSYITTAFDSFKNSALPTLSTDHLQKYLQLKLGIGTKDVLVKSVLGSFQQNAKIVFSERASMGKSLYVRNITQRCREEFKAEGFTDKTIRLTELEIKPGFIVQQLLKYEDKPTDNTPRVFHFDVSAVVTKGLYNFLVQLLILRCFQSPEGLIWRCKDSHLYIVEYLQRKHVKCYGKNLEMTTDVENSFLSIFPVVQCLSPNAVLKHLTETEKPHTSKREIQLMDKMEFNSDAYQRTYQYLTRYKKQDDLQKFTFKPGHREGTEKECLEWLLEFCGTTNPSWRELHNFTHFLNLQLTKCEKSIFCCEAVKDDLTHFKNFVVKFMIGMSKDFALPSISISDESNLSSVSGDNQEDDLIKFQLKRQWEQQAHPYIIFNADAMSMTFLGFHINSAQDAVDVYTGRTIEKNIMTRQLYEQLRQQHVPFNIRFESLSRKEQLDILCRVLGVNAAKDPDASYQLTLDNVLKMFAIHLRFQCGIPVIIMGETGCGKTRLVQFMCELQSSGKEAQNMTVIRVHGGTTSNDIYSKVKEAMEMTKENEKQNMDTVLFLDEANTTEAVFAIKEVLCDKTVNGEPIDTPRLKIIAACNPYKKHTQKAIEQLEKAGLGYRVHSEDTIEKLGHIPMRQLIYRVQPLPPSMLPLVWDFGQLNQDTQKLYITQMVKSFLEVADLPKTHAEVFTRVLSESQHHLAEKKDECRMVSLRDIERCMKTMLWFYDQREILFDLIDKKKEMKKNTELKMDDATRSLILATGVCYYSSLEHRREYLDIIGKSLCIKWDLVYEEIDACQEVFLDNVFIPESTAKNDALKENVFMMVVCMNLRVPLFLVGKPGSSKSLSKTIAADAMQGKSSKSELFRRYKQAQLVSFQCSPHSTPEGIISTFRHCAQFQKDQDLNMYVSVVVLDEIGLAEDSSKMPLKALHPLLEDGCVGDEKPEPYKKVGFIGISNWSLDPAKMNRGILVFRTSPKEKELIKTAKDICSTATPYNTEIEPLIPDLARFYMKVLEEQKSEFFGLRDYYSLVKMILCYVQEKKSKPSNRDIARAVQRNFGGLESINILNIFSKCLYLDSLDELIVSSVDLLKENLDMTKSGFTARYLLLPTTNHAALSIMQMLNVIDIDKAEIIFGSAFPKDQEYSQVCRDINRIKICMETGKSVILLNIANIYESLYDALNQCYVKLGGNYYVDLGLGSHRVKCRVKENFRLIVIEEKQVVHKQFPTPLLNRLEKHCLEIKSVLSETSKSLCNKLLKWVESFISKEKNMNTTERDTFIGYTEDTCASIIQESVKKSMCLENNLCSEDEEQILEEAKGKLIQGATPESILRLQKSEFEDSEIVNELYFVAQSHISLLDALKKNRKGCEGVCLEVSTYSRLLNQSDMKVISTELNINRKLLLLLFLNQFDTEQAFRQEISNFFNSSIEGRKLLFLQSYFEDSNQHQRLLSCVRYCITDVKKKQEKSSSPGVVLLTRLPRILGGCSYTGFSGAEWIPLHLDELMPPKSFPANIGVLSNMTIPQILEKSMDHTVENEDNDSHEPQGRLNENEKLIDMQILIKQSLQKGAVRLEDKKNNISRATTRIQIMYDLLRSENHDISQAFMTCLQNRILRLLQAQDKSHRNKDNWVVGQAMTDNFVLEGGSFRHTLWVHMEDVVASALAQVLAIIDGDDNLDNIHKQPADKTSIWLKFFQDENLLKIPPIPLEAGIQIPVFSTVDGQEISQCRFPFSWILKTKLDQIWNNVVELQGNSPIPKLDSANHFENLIKADIPWINDVKVTPELFAMYAEDLVKMSVPGQLPKLYKTFSNALVGITQKLYCQLTDEDEPCNVPLFWLHIAYDSLHTNHQIFLDICHNSKHLLTEMVIETWKKTEYVELEAAKLILMDFKPTSEKLKDFLSCLDWLQKVKSIHSTMEFITSDEFPVNLYDQNVQGLMKTIRLLWHCTQIVYLLMDHLLYSETEMETKLLTIVVKNFSFLWGYLKKKEDIDMENTFNNVIKVLKTCNTNACNVFLGKGVNIRVYCQCKLTDPAELPCGHIFCKQCFKENDSKMCTTCKTEIPENYDPPPSEGKREAIMNLRKFRSKCNTFFVEFILNYFVGDNVHMPEGIMKQLLTFVGVNTSQPEAQDDYYRQANELSPFEECMDPSPTVKSTLLKIILRCGMDKMKPHLQEYIENVVKSNHNRKEEFYFLVVRCIEDLMHKSSNEQSVDEALEILSSDIHWLDSTHLAMTIDDLQHIAMLRFVVSAATNVIGESLLSDESKAEHSSCEQRKKLNILQKMQEIVSYYQNPWIQIFLLRNLFNIYGFGIFEKICCNENYQWILPSKVNEDKETSKPVDKFLLYGENYCSMKLNFKKQCDNPSLDILQGIDEQQGVDSVCLALSVVKHICEERASKNTVHYLIKKLEECCEQNDTEATVSQICFQITQDGLHKVSEELSLSHTSSLFEVVFHVVLVVKLASNSQMELLKSLCFNPEFLKEMFFPTMHDPLEEVVKLKKTSLERLWQCSNGHLFLLENCGRPYEVSECTKCFSKIGGTGHKPVEGFTEVTEDDIKGHILGAPASRTTAGSERDLSGASLCLARVLIHSSLLWGGISYPEEIQKAIKEPGCEAGKYLCAHLVRDIELLGETIGKNWDDSVITVHLFLKYIMENNNGTNISVQSTKTREERQRWEKAMKDTIQDFFKEFDQKLSTVHQNILEKNKTNILMNIAYSTSLPLKDLPNTERPFYLSVMWKLEQRMTIQYLAHLVEQNGGKDTFPVLLEFLTELPHIHHVKHLPQILKLQQNLINSYKYSGFQGWETETIGTFVDKHVEDNKRDEFKEMLHILRKTWCHLKTNNKAANLRAELISKDISDDAMVYELLPKKGSIMQTVTNYLITLQNDCISSARKKTKETDRSISANEVRPSYVITCDPENDFLPIALSNIQYEVNEDGSKTTDYNFRELEIQLINRFISSKPTICLTTIPTVELNNVRTVLSFFNEMEGKLEPLPVNSQNYIMNNLKIVIDISSALSTLKVAIGFLALRIGDPEELLIDYIKKDLRMEDRAQTLNSPVLQTSKVKHIKSLWQLLSTKRSVLLVQMNQNPFFMIDKQFHFALSEDEEKTLETNLKTLNLDFLVIELHDLIMNLDAMDIKPDWGLTETLEPFLVGKVDEESYIQKITDSLMKGLNTSQIISVWKKAVQIRKF
ncbi:E3 ubiquitin-protein ligase rnf213-alpha [Amia ocellicauda]|uniref:E3 ubiquitin-protein ligase rnf213-alpha n=1 Tax=Amia ocellicauda TaxID=2972642 RepID=UPI0034641F03